MHPVLVFFPLTRGELPVFGVLLAVAAIAAVTGAIFAWARQRAFAVVAAGVTVLAVALAFAFRGAGWKPEVPGIQSYGAMLGLSFIVGWFVTLKLADLDGLPKNSMANCYVVTAVAALVGSRVLYVLTNLSHFGSVAEMFAFRSGGAAAYGGFLGGFVGSLVFLRSKGIPLLPWADAAVPSLGSGLFLTRIGCYLFGCDFGRPLGESAPAWLRAAGTFPRWEERVGIVGSPAWVQHVNAGAVSPLADHSLAVHPTQLYESALGLALFAGLLAMRRVRTFRGQIFFVATLAYAAGRFCLEILRHDEERGALPLAAPAHVLYPAALAVIAVAYVLGVGETLRGTLARRGSQALALAAPIALFVILRPDAFRPSEPAQLSTSQVIALLTSVAACVAYWIHGRAALARPEAAMTIDMPRSAFALESIMPPPPPGAGSRPKKKRARADDERGA